MSSQHPKVHRAHIKKSAEETFRRMSVPLYRAVAAEVRGSAESDDIAVSDALNGMLLSFKHPGAKVDKTSQEVAPSLEECSEEINRIVWDKWFATTAELVFRTYDQIIVDGSAAEVKRAELACKKFGNLLLSFHKDALKIA